MGLFELRIQVNGDSRSVSASRSGGFVAVFTPGGVQRVKSPRAALQIAGDVLGPALE